MLVCPYRFHSLFQNSLEDKADKLLQILEDKVSSDSSKVDVIPTFVRCLKKKYDWIYQRLSEDVPDSHSKVIPLPSGTSHVRFSPLRNKHLDNVLLEEEAVFEGGNLSCKEERCRKILESGGVQCLPPFSVERRDLVGKQLNSCSERLSWKVIEMFGILQLHQIRSALENLKPSRYLVLQGMAGSGKSTLATQAINDFDLLEKCFPVGEIFLFFKNLGSS